MNCIETQDLLSAFYDDELPNETRSEVAPHFAHCIKCKSQLDQFRRLSSLIIGLEQPKTPASVWSRIEANLTSDQAEKVSPTAVSANGWSKRQMLQMAAAIAATILIAVTAFSMWREHEDHREMVNAMEQVAFEINSAGTTNLLLEKFGGNEVSFDDAITQVGYRPIASKGLPPGYQIESVQKLDMPCCECIQTACLKPDKSRLFVFEHKKNVHWFEGRKKHQSEFCGKTCEVIKFDDHLAVTWRKDARYITLVGVSDDQEIELIISNFENPI